MKKAVLFGAGQVGAALARLLGPDYMPLCFADNSAAKWGTKLSGLPVVSPEKALEQKPDVIVTCVQDAIRASEMEEQLRAAGWKGEILRPELFRVFDARSAVMRMLAEQIREQGIPGDSAELGVYKGAFAAQINAALPDRTIHLFDTFTGFSERDVTIEQTEGLSRAKQGDFSDTTAEAVRERLPYPEKAIFYKGFFPETFRACDAECFAFVSIDADLYAPTAAALPIFFDRLSPGGVLMIHDVYSTQFTGAKKAVDEFCAERKLLPFPVPDLHGSAVIRKN